MRVTKVFHFLCMSVHELQYMGMRMYMFNMHGALELHSWSIINILISYHMTQWGG